MNTTPSPRESLPLRPGPRFRQWLAGVLRAQGRFAESLGSFRRGHELRAKRPGWRYPSAERLREGERLAALEGKLGAWRKGEYRPKDTAERSGLLLVCQAKKLNHASARLLSEAFADDPKLAAELKTGDRYNAKSEYLAAEAHLAAWAGRTRLRHEELQARLQGAGLPCDPAASLQIARWVYQQTERANGQVWLVDKELAHLGPAWAQCFAA